MRCSRKDIVIALFICILGLDGYAQKGSDNQVVKPDGTALFNSLDQVSFPAAIVFLDEECPVSQKYSRTLLQLQDTYGDKVSFVAVFLPDLQGNTGALQYVRDFGFRGSVINDLSFSICDQLEAKVTPEVFLLDQNRNLLYRGAIDNWYYALGKYRRVVTEHYLEDALTALIAGESPAVTETQAIGCFINQTVRARK